MTITELIAGGLVANPDATVLAAPSRKPLSHRALQGQVSQVVRALRNAAIGHRDRVAVVLPSGPEMAAAVVAVMSGAVCAPLNPRYTVEEFRSRFADLAVKALLLAAAEQGPVRVAARDLGVRCLDVAWHDGVPAGCFEFVGFDASPGPQAKIAGRARDIASRVDDIAPRADDLALLLQTSGTTSRPKLVPLSHGNLSRSARNVAQVLQLSSEDRCLAMMPLFHIHGIVASLLAPLGAGGSVACVPGYRAGEFLPWLSGLQPTWITAVPVIYQAIVAELERHPTGAIEHRLRLARSASAPMPPTLMREIERVLKVPVVEAYGMTEAAHQIASNPIPPGVGKPGSVGIAAGPEVVVLRDGALLRPGGDRETPDTVGEIVIRGENVTRGYLDDAQANADTFVDGWLRTGDQGYIDSDGYLFLTGRIKDLINRGGEKIAPREIDEALIRHPSIDDAVAFGIRHETLGQIVAAAIVLKPGAEADDDSIRKFLSGRIADHKIPSRIFVVDSIPRNATGKIQRTALESQFAHSVEQAFVAPLGEIESGIATIFADILGVAKVGSRDDFFALGGDSLRGMRVLLRLNQQLGDELSIRDLFKAPTPAALAKRLANIREASKRDGEASKGNRDASNGHRAVKSANGAEGDYPRDRCIHQLFEEHVSHNPGATAVRCDEASLTYAELNARANRLAHHLIGLRVGPDTLVAVCLPRSLELVVALLGILKAGGAYVPLDPDYPAARLAFMLDDTNAPVLLTQEPLLAKLPAYSGHSVCLDRDLTPLAIDSDPPCRTTPEHLAYVLYTSGSTGEPKGVMVPHRAIVRLVRNTDYIQLTASDCVAQVSNPSFDAVTFEIWGALANGARLAVLPRDAVLDPPLLARMLRRENVSTLFLTTALFNAVMRVQPDAFVGLKQVLFGGEAVDPRWVSACLDTGPPQRLLHVYGPTESTTFATWYPIIVVPPDATTLPIGKPIANTTAQVLDPQQQPVPMGTPGELYLGGDGLARGYWRRPELTAERFVADPGDGAGVPIAGARFYRTGDRVRMLADGNIEFLGRFDEQIKLRGFRIEPGEIEALLRKRPQLSEALVQLRKDLSGEPLLVAYLVADKDRLDADGLREALKHELPGYMIPAAFVQLTAFPLTPNGKVDRSALPAPGQIAPTQSVSSTTSGSPAIAHDPPATPRDPVERQLVAIWETLLDHRPVAAHDNFFDLGGHSLMAVRLIARVRESFGVDLPVRALFENPTLCALAGVIRDAQEQSPIHRLLDELESLSDEDAAAQVSNREASLCPLSFGQKTLWLLDQLLPLRSIYNLTRTAPLKGPLDLPALRLALNDIVQRHEPLRSRIVLSGAMPLQQIAAEHIVALDIEDLTTLPESERFAEAQQRARAEAMAPFDLGEGPLLRVRLLRFAEDKHWLLVTLHHIVADDRSFAIFWKELAAFYGFHLGLSESPPAALSIHYADYVAWQRRLLDSELLDRQLSYWRQALAGLPALALPYDRPRPHQPSHRGRRVSLDLSDALVQSLRALARREGTTLFTTQLAALQMLLHRLTGQDDFAIGVPVAGRRLDGVDGLIGYFVNTVVIRGDLSGTPTFTDCLRRTHARAQGAYAHQDVPFEMLVERLHPDRDPSRHPFFQVMLNQWTADGHLLRLPGFEPSRVRTNHTESSKFDLEFIVHATPERYEVTIEYATELFSAERIEELAQQYRTLLEQVAEAPDRSVLRYSLVTPDARRKLPDPGASIDEPEQVPVPRLVADWAKRRPDAIAVSHDGRQSSYRTLHDAAVRVARALRAQGVGRGDVVAIIGPSSFGLVSSMLGVSFSGAAFLTIDPTLPEPRRRTMLREARAKAICAVASVPEYRVDSDDAATLPSLAVDPDEGPDLTDIGQDPVDEAAWSRIESGDPAYVFFTSGSTGIPKGVLGSHKGLAHFLAWQRETFAIGATDRVAQLTSLSFDVLLRDVFLPLTSGGTLCIPDESDRAWPLAWLTRERVSVVHTVPTLVQSWLGEVHGAVDLTSLRWLFLSGEPLPVSLSATWRGRVAGSAEIVNLYGPTETTLVKCFCRVAPDMTDARVPVGRPLPQTQALVLNAAGQLCGIGEPGEVVLRTPFRTLGYVNSPDETSLRFVPNPFRRDDPSDLLYRTGDRGCYRPDGSLDLLGRLDDQVKIRGVRIEPGDVQAVLEEHPSVRACVVLGRTDAAGEPMLVAYLMPAAKSGVSAADLRSFAAARLPPVMIPTAWVVVDKMPRLPNGKVDRAALPAPADDALAESGERILPQTDLESTLGEIWQELLGIETPGVHDNFFEVGGHSLRAAQFATRIRQRLGVAVPARQIFATPTIAELAGFIARLPLATFEASTTARRALQQ